MKYTPADEPSERAEGRSLSALEPLWEPLSEERRRELAFKWVDMAVRRMLAESFANAGCPHQAGVLRGLPPIRDMSTRRQAEKTLRGLQVPLQPMDMVASYFDTVATLETLDDSRDIYECCFLAVMASRLTYKNDRSVDEMRRDLLATAP
jgi:hypothetical protein